MYAALYDGLPRHFRFAGCDDRVLCLDLSATLPFGRPDQGQNFGPFFRSRVELERLVDDVLACGELKSRRLASMHERRDAAVSHGFHGLGLQDRAMGHAFLAVRSTGNACPKPDSGGQNVRFRTNIGKNVRSLRPAMWDCEVFQSKQALTAR